MDYRNQLLLLVTLYRASSKLSDARISTLIFNHGARIKQIRKGAGFTVSSFEHALQWFSNHWPNDLDWPDYIPRPEQQHETPLRTTKQNRKKTQTEKNRD